MNPLTGAYKQDAFYFSSDDVMKPVSRSNIVSEVAGRLYLTGRHSRATGSFGTDILQFIGLDYSSGGLPTKLVHKKTTASSWSGLINSAFA